MAAEFTPDPGEGTGLDEAIAAYLTACEVEGKTRRTVQAYAETLGRFRTVCAAEGLPDRVAAFRAAHVYAFLKVISDSGVSLGTRHRRFRETRAFFSWCTRMGACGRNPFAGIPNVKVEQKVIQPLTEAEIQALLDVCDPTTEFGCRNRAIILLFLDTGLRYAELHGLTLEDVDWEAGRIHVRHGKGRKQRVVAFGAGPSDALRDYGRTLPRCSPRGPVPHHPAADAAAAPDEPVPLGDAFPAPGRPGRRPRQPPPLPSHLRHLGDREPRPGAGRAVPLGPLHLGHGAPLLGDLRRGQGGRSARRLQPRRPLARNRGQRGRLSLLPKQRVAGSNPVSRSNTPHEEETGPPPEPPMRRRLPTICFLSRMTVPHSAATDAAATAAAAHAAFSPAARLLAAG